MSRVPRFDGNLGRSCRVGAALVGVALTAAACGGGSASGPQSVKGSATGGAPTAAAPSGYAPWPEAERDATHSSQATVHGPQSGHIVWKASLGGPSSAGPSIASDGTIYEANDAGVLHAINPATGQTRWTFSGGGPVGGDDLSTTAAVLPDGTIVWPGSRHMLFGLSPAGKQLWSLNVGGVPLSPVVATPNSVYVMTTNGMLSAVQITADSAAPRWTLRLGAASLGSPVIRPDGVVETTVDDSLVAVRDLGSSAKLLWRYTTGHVVEVSPATGPAGITVLGSNDGVEYGISSTGKQLWQHTVGGYSFSSPAVTHEGTAYFGDNHGTLTVASATTGKDATTFDATVGTPPPGNIWTAPLVDSAGDVYYGTNNGHVYGYSASGSQLFDLATGQTVDSYPAMTSGGDLLIASDDGYLYSIGR